MSRRAIRSRVGLRKEIGKGWSGPCLIGGQVWSRVSASAKCRNDPFLRDEVTMEWECLALLCVVDGVYNPGRGGFFFEEFQKCFFLPLLGYGCRYRTRTYIL